MRYAIHLDTVNVLYGRHRFGVGQIDPAIDHQHTNLHRARCEIAVGFPRDAARNTLQQSVHAGLLRLTQRVSISQTKRGGDVIAGSQHD